MLIEFSVENYRSINGKQTLSMETASIKEFPENIIGNDKYKLLSSTAVYGANSSGKSNFIRAMNIMRHFVQENFEKSSVNRLPHDPYLLNTLSADKSSHFEILFLIENIRYRYGFEINKKKVVSEWLFEMKKNTEKPLFIRVEDGIEVMPDFKEGKGMEERTRDNALFLSVVDQFNGKTANKIIKWFKNFNIISGLNHEDYRGITFSMLEAPETYEILKKYYQQIDLGFEDITILKKELTEDDLPNDIPEDIMKQLFSDLKGKTAISMKTMHKLFNETGEQTGLTEFDVRRQESSGTNKIIDLSGPIFNTFKEGGILVVDELDAKLHPLLTLSIIRLFQNRILNKNNAQLIFATHDSNLLSLARFRRDQIYFIEKDKFGASQLYSLVEYKQEKVRNDRSFEKDYLNGRYGAIPYLENINKLENKWQEK